MREKREFEIRSFPSSLAATLRGFTLYVAVPSARFANDAVVERKDEGIRIWVRKPGIKDRAQL